MLTLVLFDVDGTLIDSQAHILAAMTSAFDGAGLTAPSRDDVLSIVGLSLDQAFFKLTPETDATTRAQMVEAYKNAFNGLRQSLPMSPLYPGAMDVLKELSQRDDLILGVATGKSRRGMEHVLDSHALRDMFVTVQVADDHPSKPHPAMALTAMLESGADRGVMIGDTTYDMDMGRAAGLKTLGVTWGYHPRDVLVSRADVCADHFDAIPQTLTKLWSMA